MQQQGKIFLPSPKFELKLEENKSCLSTKNFIKTQVKCLASHKLSFKNLNDPPDKQTVEPSNPLKGYKLNQFYNNSQKQWCEVCDKGFVSFNEFNKHKGEHKVCGIGGCKFYAEPSIVSKHVEVQHSSGLFSEIQKLSTLEEIAKWREERKKRYPTRTNVELRQKAQEARIKRGEKLENPKNRFGNKRDRNSARSSECQQSRPNKGYRDRLRRQNKFDSKRKTDHVTENSKIKIKRVDVNSKANEKTAEIIKEDENEEYNSPIPKFKGTRNLTDYERPKKICERNNPIFSLVGMYGSDSSDGELSDSEVDKLETPQDTDIRNKEKKSSATEEIPSKKIINDLEENNFEKLSKLAISSENTTFKTTLTSDTKKELKSLESLRSKNNLEEPPMKRHTSMSDDEMPEELPIVKIKENLTEDKSKVSSNLAKTQNKESVANNNRIKKSLLNNPRLKYRRQNTLLEKLLQPDIRHERNVLMQCVRFVVENNFFGVGSTKS